MSSPTPPTQFPPGWYPDANGRQRWWSGQGWTEHVAPRSGRGTGGRIVVVTLMVLGVLALIAVSIGFVSGIAGKAGNVGVGSAGVMYRVTGSAPSASISYGGGDASGSGIESVSKVALPWSRSREGSTSFGGASYSLVAQSDGDGTITCEILIDGVSKVTKTSSGEYGVVTCATAG